MDQRRGNIVACTRVSVRPPRSGLLMRLFSFTKNVGLPRLSFLQEYLGHYGLVTSVDANPR